MTQATLESSKNITSNRLYLCVLIYVFYICVTAGSVRAQEIYPFIFDDFDYDVAPLVGSPSSNPGEQDLFGVNRWYSSSDNGGTWFDSRAWRRYNWADHKGIDGRIEFRIPSDSDPNVLRRGVMRLVAEAGTPGGAKLPAVPGGFLVGDGTFVARVRFSDVPQAPSGWMMSAFWGMSPSKLRVGNVDYWSETDFEWNSWKWDVYNGSAMSIGNHYGYDTSDSTSISSGLDDDWSYMDCGAWDGSNNYVVPGCAQMNHPVSGEELSISNRWLWLVFTIEQGERVTWYLYLPGDDVGYWGGAPLLGSQLPEWELARSTHAYVPVRDMHPSFSMHWNGADSVSVMPSDWHMDIDYFYYTDTLLVDQNDNINLDGIRNQIDLIRNEYRPLANDHQMGLRVNTININGAGFYKDEDACQSSYPSDPNIIGPEIVRSVDGSGYTNQVRLEPVSNGSGQVADIWQYKVMSCNDVWGSWNNVGRDTFDMNNDITQFSKNVRFKARVSCEGKSSNTVYKTVYNNNNVCGSNCIGKLCGANRNAVEK